MSLELIICEPEIHQHILNDPKEGCVCVFGEGGPRAGKVCGHVILGQGPPPAGLPGSCDCPSQVCPSDGCQHGGGMGGQGLRERAPGWLEAGGQSVRELDSQAVGGAAGLAGEAETRSGGKTAAFSFSFSISPEGWFDLCHGSYRGFYAGSQLPAETPAALLSFLAL